MSRRPVRVLPSLGRIAGLVFSGPLLGSAYMLLLTVLSFRTDDDRYMGVRAAPVVEMARNKFAEDVSGLTWSLAAIAVGYGAAIGICAELMLAVRERLHRSPLRSRQRWLWRVVLVVAVQLAELGYGIAHNPQLYADALYAREGMLARFARPLQIVLTDVLGTKGVVVLYVGFVLAVMLPPARELIAAARANARRMLAATTPIAALVSALVVVVGLASVLAPGRAHAHRGGRPNVVILAVDSLRDDRLNPRTAPRLASVAASGVRFTNAYVTVGRTLPSWATILTGREPHHHGLRTMFPRYDDRARDLSALPARLGTLGYKSAVVGDYAADIFTRIRFGYDIIDAPTFNFHALIATRALERAMPLLPVLQGRIGRSVMPAMRELNQAADPTLVAADACRTIGRLSSSDSPFFLTVFFSTAHFPYAAPAPFYDRYADPAYRGRFKYHKPNLLGQEAPLDAADVKQVRALYDGAVSSVDEAAGTILDDLSSRGLDDDTIVLVTADHGEMLYDDGHGQGHGDHLFGDQVMRVPLAIRVPTRLGLATKARRVDDAVRDIDLAPTILSLVGAPSATTVDLDGRSLQPLLEGRTLPARPVFGETEVWMTEAIPELPATGPAPLRLPYPNVSLVTELDPRLGYDIVLRAEAEPLIIAAKHRMILDGPLKLIYVPTRKGARYILFDRSTDPAETRDVAAERASDVGRLRNDLWRWMLGDSRMEEHNGLLVPRWSDGSTSGAGRSDALRMP